MKFIQWFIEGLLKPFEAMMTQQNNSTSNQYQSGCPKCGSSNIQVVTDVIDNTKVQGYGVGKGCLGSILMCNPFGLLCGLCGMGKKKGSIKTIHSRVCANCGYKF